MAYATGSIKKRMFRFSYHDLVALTESLRIALDTYSDYTYDVSISDNNNQIDKTGIEHLTTDLFTAADQIDIQFKPNKSTAHNNTTPHAHITFTKSQQRQIFFSIYNCIAASVLYDVLRDRGLKADLAEHTQQHHRPTIV